MGYYEIPKQIKIHRPSIAFNIMGNNLRLVWDNKILTQNLKNYEMINVVDIIRRTTTIQIDDQ